MVTALAVHSQRKLSGKALAAVVHAEGVETRWARWTNKLRALASPGSPPKLGPWMALEGSMAHSDRIEQRLSARIDALESEVAGLRGEAKPEAARKAEGDRIELELRGEITSDVCDRLIRRIEKASPRDEIVLRITSNGGDHPSSLSLTEALLAHKGPTRIIAEGKCHSAAATVFMAADRDARIASHDAEFLIHAGSFTNMPPYWTAEFARGHESADSDNLARWFSRRTGRSWFSFRRMLKTAEGETMNAKRALELGIVSHVLPAPTRTRRSSPKRKSKQKAKQ